MAASVYLLESGEYAEYGVPLCRPEQVLRASLLIDHFLRRPEGLVWMADVNGQPAYMAAKVPNISYVSPTPILPGTNVVVPIPNYIGDNDSLIGECVVLDRLNPALVESCVVQAVQAGQVTLTKVQFNHSATPLPVSLEFGMAINEEKSLPSERATTRLCQWPVVQLLSGVGRYSYGRRNQQEQGYYYDLNLLSTMAAFGGPPAWTSFTIPASSLNPDTGDLWVPAGVLLSYYTEVKIRYVAGWSATGLPPQIKIACAEIVRALQAAPMGPQIRRFGAGKLTTERFADTVMDDNIRSMLRPYMAAGMV